MLVNVSSHILEWLFICGPIAIWFIGLALGYICQHVESPPYPKYLNIESYSNFLKAKDRRYTLWSFVMNKPFYFF